MDVHVIVRQRMEELGMTRAELSRRVAPAVKQRTVYDFIAGGPLNAVALGHVLDALGLKLSASPPDERQLRELRELERSIRDERARLEAERRITREVGKYAAAIYRRARRLSGEYRFTGHRLFGKQTPTSAEWWKGFNKYIDEGNPKYDWYRFRHDYPMAEIEAVAFDNKCPYCSRELKTQKG